jgi:hypothetical protein
MDNARQAQVVNLAARIHNHNTLGHRAVMVVNGIVPDTTARTVVDGMMYENWPNFRGFGPGMKAYLAGGKDGVIAVYCTTCNQIPDGSQYNATSCREARFALGSASMGDGYGFFGPAELTPPAGSTYLDWYYDEYSVDIGNDATADTTGAHLGWLGDPLGPATQLTTDVWVRYFNNGAAIVNGSGSPATLTPAPSAGYRKIRGIHDPTINDGSSVTSVTVVPHDALFLLRAQIDHVRPAAVTDLRVGP